MISIPFLKETANYLLEPGAYDLPVTCIVFPNKRARLYLSKYISELTTKPVWAPQYITISELMEVISGYCLADKLTLLFELYLAYTDVSGSNESFDSFYPYSEALLADFDEIDKYLINAADLFQNLSGLKALDGKFNYLSEEQITLIRRFWATFKDEQISGDQKSFITLWDLLPQVYLEYRKRLVNQNMAYEGMAYQKAIELMDKENPALSGFGKFIFIGFNALNTCEERFFRHLKNTNRAEFFWDYDEWYVNNEIHEAGYFMRKNIRNFAESRPMNHNHLLKKKNHIFFIPVSSNSGQASVLPDIFEKMGVSEKEEIESTALVLADEGLLMQALYAIPEEIPDINVTMGYPLAGSSVFSLVDSVYELTRNSRKDTSGNSMWYFRDVLAVMNNPMLHAYYSDKSEYIRKKAMESHIVYFLTDQINNGKPDELIFNDYLHGNASEFLLNVVASVIRLINGEKQNNGHVNQVQLELLFQVYTYLTRLKDLLADKKIDIGSEVLFRLVRKMLRGMHVPFSGEPLAGLQVLGILETRTLDFNNVIMLSVNEGVFPGSTEKPSFIPFNLRAGFGMPTPEHYDAIYAYYFYRLIQRADNIAFTYDSSSAGLRTGERSRFLHQLYYEMHLPVTELIVSASIAQIPVKSIVIEKTEEIQNVLRKYYSKEAKVLSPSAINEFLNCSLRYYFHHIADLPQPEEPGDEVDASLFGSILHCALKLIYGSFGKTSITRERLLEIIKNEALINNSIDSAFNEVLFGDPAGAGNRKPEGYNLIVRQVIYTYIRQFLKAEAETAPFTIISLEERYSISLPVKIDGSSYNVKVGGIIDRIDLHEGNTRILDYKTGSVKDKFNTVDSLFSAEEKLRNDAVFQVLLYAFVYQKIHPDVTIAPGLFFMRQSNAADFSSKIKMGPKKEIVDDYKVVHEEFELFLGRSLERLFDSRMPFRQTANLQVCSFCPYALICRRVL